LIPRTPPVVQEHAATPPAPAPAEPTPSGLVIPVANVRAADLTDTFGDPRGIEGERGHGALDIPAPRGTPVLAAAGGTIEKIFESELGGHTIYVRTTDGATIHYYAHLQAYAPGLHEGQQVRQGETIGLVGSTGDANPAAPHLHFQILHTTPQAKWWEPTTAVNPYPLLTHNSKRTNGIAR